MRFRVCLVLVAILPGLFRADASSRGPAHLVSRFRRLEPVRRTDQLIVKFRVVSDAGLHERRIREVGGASARRSAYGSWYQVTLEPGVGLEQALADFRTMPEVEYAEPNGAVWAAFTPNDEFFSE